jgi:hypothetical protein
MERWQHVWQFGIAPQLTESGLHALRQALVRDDPRLVQGRTIIPPPLVGLDDAEVEAACAVGWTGWQGDGVSRVADLERYFERICSTADEALGEPGACRHFFDWFDATPRATVRRWMLRAVDAALNQGLVAA